MILWTNGIFYTMENEKTFVNQVLTKDGIILALGDDVNKYTPNKIVDLKGGYVFPGFTESHMHLIGYGRRLKGFVLKDSTNKENVLKEIKSNYNNDKLLVQGYFDIGITKDQLDNITTSNYIILRHNDYHSFTVNSKVLNDLNISSVDGIIKDETITPLIKTIWESNNEDKLKEFAYEAVDALHKNGFTSVHTDDLSYFNSYEETLSILKEVSENKKIRVNTLIHHEILDNYINSYPKSKYLNDIQIKLFYDGTISSKTALINGYYTNTNNNGIRIMKQNEFKELFKKIRTLNKGVAIHSIGDKSLDEILEILSNYSKSKEIDRIIHASLVSDKSLNIIENISIDIQPSFIVTDKEFINKNINHKTNIYPYDKLIKKGLLVNMSSDAPVEEIDPIYNLSIIDNIDRFDLIKTYTVNPYLTINKKGGLIKEGYYADFTVFDSNILTNKKEELLKTKIKYTIVDETIVYNN